MKKITIFFLCLLGSLLTANAQKTFPVNGVFDEREGHFAFTGATIYTNYNKKIDNATLVIKEGKVVSVQAGKNVPKGAVEIDVKGMFIYPSFIDIYSNYGVPEVKKNDRKWNEPQVFVSKKSGAYGWNEAIKPEINAFEMFKADSKSAKTLKDLGFGAVLSHQKDGIARGSGVFILLGDENENDLIITDKAAAHYAFSKGQSSMSYPSSLMGMIALIRQTYLDADWYAGNGSKEEYNISLDSWNKLQDLPQIFEVNSHLDVLRADKIGNEFGVDYIVKSRGHEYKRIDRIKKTNCSFITSLNFPEAFDVEDPFDASNVSLKAMKHWELAPTNPAALAKAGIPFAITTADLKKPDKEFYKKLQKAIKNGLSKEDALKALTYTPANLLNQYDKIGSLERGKYANFIIASGEMFAKKTSIHENWIKGKRYQIKNIAKDELTAVYDLKIKRGLVYELVVSGKPGAEKYTITLNDSTDIKVNGKYSDKEIHLDLQLIKTA